MNHRLASLLSTIASLVFGAAITLGSTGASSATAGREPSHGQWTLRLASPAETGAQVLMAHIALRTPGLNTLYVPFQKLEGLSPDKVSSGRGNLRFRLREDAGTIQFEGAFEQGRGSGVFDFTPDPNFAAELRRRGMESPTLEQQFEMARHEIGLDLLDELAKNGYARPTTAATLSAGINGVDVQYVREMARLGYHMETVEALVGLRVNGVDPAQIRELATLGYSKLSSDDLLNLAVEGVNTAFIRKMNARAGQMLSVGDLVRLRVNGAQ
jgi:hypothetical protein